MKWTVHGERSLYESPWVGLHLADVEVPGGERFEHHVIRSARPAAGLVVEVDDRFLLLWRHHFITDAWGWEIPYGGVEGGESLADAARRETIEETGWAPDAVTPLLGFDAMNGICDQRIEVFHASAATKGGPTHRQRREFTHRMGAPRTGVRGPPSGTDSRRHDSHGAAGLSPSQVTLTEVPPAVVKLGLSCPPRALSRWHLVP